MKIEVGKKYRTRLGNCVVEITGHTEGDKLYSFFGTSPDLDHGRPQTFRADGGYFSSGESVNDLVAEIDGNGEPIETGGCAPPVIVDPVERAINPPVFIDLTSGAVNVVGAPPAGPVTPPQPSARQLASALRLLVREADRYSDYADNSLQLTDAIILAESVLDRLAP